MDDRKSQPLFLVVLLAVLGLSTLPRGLPSDNSASKSAALKVAGGADTTRDSLATATGPRTFENPDLGILGPILDLTNDGSRPRISERVQPPQFDNVGREELANEIVARTRARRGTVRAMIALLPDPVRTSASQDFDSQLDGIERAAEAAGFVLAQYWFPWDELDKSDKNQAAERRSAALKPSQNDVKVPWTPRWNDLPGLLVFRKEETLLAMFIVLETPTRGLRKHQFNWSLDLISAFADAEAPTEDVTVPRSFHILGPRYTGTARSLNQAIDGWLTRTPSERLLNARTIAPVFLRSHRFSIAPAATEINAVTIKKLPAVNCLTKVPSFPYNLPRPKPQTIVFRAATNPRNDVTKALTDFLDEQFGQGRIAMLVESNTSLGRALQKPHPNNDHNEKDRKNNSTTLDSYRSSENTSPAAADAQSGRIEYYHYPLHIASLRASYEKQGLLGDPGGQVFHSAGRLEVAPEENERRRDVVAPATPEFSTRVDELVMVQTMTEIARQISLGHYTAVGIAGSSSLDVIFLAQLVNKYSPDAVLFTTMSDLLFTQPQTISDLRGMLIGSSYPLYAPNRRWSYPYGAGADVFFNQESVQAIYNATTFLLAEILEDDKDVTARTMPLEFSLPFEPFDDHPRPPIWISIVGNRGIYPIHVAKGPDPENANRDQWPLLHRSTTAIPMVFKASYHSFWKILEGLLLTLGYALFCLALLELWWVVARIKRKDLHRWRVWRILDGLASFLVWSRAPQDKSDDPHAKNVPRSSSGHGPGILLLLAQCTFLLIFVAVNQPFLLPGSESPLNEDVWHWLAIAGFWLALVSLTVSLVSWFALAVEKRAVKRLALMAAVVVVSVLGGLFWILSPRYHPYPATYLALERIVSVTSGVSPTFPILFVGLAAMSFFTAQFKRCYLNEQFSLRNLRPDRKFSGDSSDRPPDALTGVEEKIDELKGVFHKLLRVVLLGDLIPTILLAAYLVTFAGIGLYYAFSARLGEGPVFTYVFWGLFSALSVLVAFHVYLVYVAWSHLSAILAQVSRLPLARSFERMPARVARWFFETPRPQNRSAMIQDQANALAGRCAQVRPAFERVRSQSGVSSAEWDSLPRRLDQINDGVTATTAQSLGGWKIVRSWLAPVSEFFRDSRGYARVFRVKSRPGPSASTSDAGRRKKIETYVAKPVDLAARMATQSTTGEMNPRQDEANPIPDANEILKKILRPIWNGRPLTWTFAEGKNAEKVQEEAGAGWPILPTTAAALLGKADAGETDTLVRVREWTEMAEDLITLQLLRHLSQFLAQIWVIVRFIVIGSLTLLLAINSYPFPMQRRIGFFLAIMIGVAAWAILRLVIGINRDETISRVANATAGFKLDRNLATGMIGYILPLIGILAAASYDMSDLLRVWLDPVFRILR